MVIWLILIVAIKTLTLIFIQCKGKLSSLPQPPSHSDKVDETSVVEDEDEDSYEMEISEDMLEFFAKSMKHKKELSNHSNES